MCAHGAQNMPATTNGRLLVLYGLLLPSCVAMGEYANFVSACMLKNTS